MWKKFSMLWVLVKGDARRLWYALRHPHAPGWLKGGTALLLLYLVSPIDLIPEAAIPFIGLVDDFVLIPAAIRWMLNRLPAQVRADADRRAGIHDSNDARTVDMN
ncbi:MAG TPA: YkvA family protein [Burkholderiaceae bacterium]|nr:YkvA family protein [Burkholderiaceae bacterium]